MKHLIILTIVISLLSCSAQKLPYEPAKKDWDCLTELGQYDTSCVVKGGFFKFRCVTTDVYFLGEDSCVTIWGEECNFRKGEPLYAKGRWVSYPGYRAHCKYDLINKSGSLRYSLLDQK